MSARKRRLKAVKAKTKAVTPFSSLVPQNFRLPRRFHAAVGRNAEGKPAWFLFDLIAFWEFVCRVDERLFDSLSDEMYEQVSLGSMNDALESDWPFSKEFTGKVQKAYTEALRDIKAGKIHSL